MRPLTGPPYSPSNAALGGVPTVGLDVPITVVFMIFFMTGAVGHMTVLQLNRRKGHKFLMSGLMFGFCMARITTCVMRIVWATRPTNVRIAIAAGIFVAAGVLLLFVVNLIFAQRIIRASHPHSGWKPLFSWIFKVCYIIIVLTLLLIISFTVLSFYTLDHNLLRISRDITLYAGTWNAFVSFLPIPLIIGGLIVPRKTRVEKFGSGRFRTKVTILLAAAFLLCLGASFRAGTNYLPSHPRTSPGWYQSKACFYIFNFTIDLTVVLFYLIVRVDRRFHVPDGSKGPGDYLGSRTSNKEMNGVHGEPARRIMTEEEVFDDEPQSDDSKEKHQVQDEEKTSQGTLSEAA